MGDIAVRVEGLSKRYFISGKQKVYRTFRDVITDTVAAPARRVANVIHGRTNSAAGLSEPIWALKDVSFAVKHGEVIGIIGRNGAGKSTLLKILSRITEPTAGRVKINGRVGALLEVGTGFHPELTGRENIYLNAAILGMSKSDTARKFDEIVAFSEVEKFIDTPVKYYSSGMGLRLGFAVAAHLEPEILIVDEVLAVGDASFQKKCIGKMGEVATNGHTVLFVSHDMSAIQNLTSSAVVLRMGSVDFIGRTNDAIEAYLQDFNYEKLDLSSRMDRVGDGLVRIESMYFLNAQGIATQTLGAGEATTIVLSYKTIYDINPADLVLDLHFCEVNGHRIATVSTRFSPVRNGISTTSTTLYCEIPSLQFTEGTYTIDFWLAYRGGLADSMYRATEIHVLATDYFGTGQLPVARKHGSMLLKHYWFVSHDPKDI